MGCQCSKGLSILSEVTWHRESMDMGSDHFDFHSKLGHLRSQGSQLSSMSLVVGL